MNTADKEPLLIAIDGRCASGKSIFARWLGDQTGAMVLHMDDFFLRPSQRTPERYATPGGNVDYERFLEEVLIPLSRQEPFLYQPFDCTRMELGEARQMTPSRITVIEGSYSTHPALKDYYDITVFLTADPETQMKRIARRNPDKTERFRNEWIPYEELFFSRYDTENTCMYVIDTSDLF